MERTMIIRQVAVSLASAVRDAIPDQLGETIDQYARRQNANGWTFDVYHDHTGSSWTRVEGAQLNQTELAEALQQAQRIMTDPDYR
jgi:hypothetical protein